MFVEENELPDTMHYANPRFDVFGNILVELEHPKLGWVPFLASPEDSVDFGRALHAEILSKEPGHVAPYEGPPLEEFMLNEWRQSVRVSAFQAKAMLLQAGYWEDVSAYLAGADPVTQLAWETAQEFRRLSPTILEIAEVLEISDEQLDDLFRFAATIEA